METNELPETDYTRIQNEAEYAASLMGNNRYIKMGFSSGAQAEYIRFQSILQSCEEQLKAKDEQNERLREALNIWQEADSLNLEMESSILNTEQRKRVISLLSQSTEDKLDHSIPRPGEPISPQPPVPAKETDVCNHPSTDKGPDGIYCVVCLEVIHPYQSTDKQP